MNKLLFSLLGSALALGVVACNGPAKTSSDAPSSTNSSSPTSADQSTAQSNQNDATSEMRRKQLNSDIRSTEQRNNVAGDKSVRTDADLKSMVRSKLEANLPASSLAIDAKDGAVTVTGSVVNQEQIQKIEPLAKQINGVKSVAVKATVSSATPAPAKPGSDVPINAQTGSKK